MNKFAAAKTSTAPKAKKDDKVIVTLTDASQIQALNEFAKAKKAKDEAEAAMSAASGILKEFGQSKVIENFEKTSRKLESFVITDGKVSVIFGVQDNYKRSNLDEDRIKYLKDTYGEDVIDMSTTYKFNAELVEKHGQAISDVIDLAANGGAYDKDGKLVATLPKEVADNLVECDNKPRIKKGTIDFVADIARKAKTSIAQFYNDICPTQYLKERGSK